MPNDSPDDARPGRPVLALFVFLVAVFAGGALLAPGLYGAVQMLAPDSEIARMAFGRYVNRGLLIVALVGLPFYVRASGIRRWSDVGLEPRSFRWRRFAAGFGVGFVSLAAVCAVALLAGGRELRPRTAGDVAAQFAGALATALVVAVIEELLFRGAIFGGLRRAMRWPAALLLSSAIYAIVHFLARPATPAEVDWLSGLRMLPTALRGATELHTLLPAFLSLTLAGVILGLAYQRTGDLAASIGIHAGWIFWLKFYGLLTRSVPGANAWLWGTRKLVDGWFAFFAIVLVLAVVWLAARRRAAPS